MKSQTDLYCIRVRGHLDKRWTAWFDRFELKHVGEDTVLRGPVSDQAALHGVFAKIRDLGLPILLVENLTAQSANATKTANTDDS